MSNVDRPALANQPKPVPSTLAMDIRRYAFAVAMVALAFGLKKLMEPLTGTGAPFVLFFGAVVAACVWGGPGPGILATVLSAPIGAYEFVVRAGYSVPQAINQGVLFAIDGTGPEDVFASGDGGATPTAFSRNVARSC